MGESCRSCSLAVAEQRVAWGGVVYHSSCFVCARCTSPLSGGISEQAGKLLCNSCSPPPAGSCSACARPLEGSVITTPSAAFHAACFTCQFCNKPIGGGYGTRPGNKRICQPCSQSVCFACEGLVMESKRVVVDGQTCHLGCALCKKCGSSLAKSAGKVFGKFLLCTHHYAEAVGGGGFNPEKGCARCGERITSKVLMAMNKQWHRDCFTCTECRAPLTGPFLDMDGEPYCLDDFKALFGLTCAACDGAINEKYFLVNDNKFHQRCIICTLCSQPLKPGEAVLMPGKAYRVHCACVQCAGCGVRFSSRDPVYMKANEPVAFCVSCKLQSRGQDLTELSGSIVMTSLESGGAKPAASRPQERKLYPTPAGPAPVASAAEMAEFGRNMKLLAEVLVEEEAKNAGKAPLAASSEPKPKPAPRPVSDWVATPDAESGDVYYVNTKTQDVSWDMPADFSGRVVDAYGTELPADKAKDILARIGYVASAPEPEAAAAGAEPQPLQKPPAKGSLGLEELRFHMVTPLSAPHLDRKKLEDYLTEEAFFEALGVTRDEFSHMPLWKCEQAKRQANLI